MNANTSKTMYEDLPAVSGLNRVQGFDPRKFMRRTVSEQTKQEVLYLDLKYKKLWFRLAYPKGRIKKTALKITEQIAIMEAKIFLDKDDAEPVSSFIAQRNAGGKPGSLYIEAAQYAAENQALVDAGFGLQFCDVSQGPDAEHFDAGVPSVYTEPAEEESLTDEQALIIMAATNKNLQKSLSHEDMPAQQTDVAPETAAAETTQEVQAIQQDDEAPVPQTDPAETAAADTSDVQTENETSSQPDAPEAADAADVEQPAAKAVLEMITGGAPQNTEVEAPPANPNYTADMPVDEILAQMTPEEAAAVVVDTGTCNGWTLAEVAEKRPASLKWYQNGYTGDNNIMKAGAKMMLDIVMERKAS